MANIEKEDRQRELIEKQLKLEKQAMLELSNPNSFKAIQQEFENNTSNDFDFNFDELEESVEEYKPTSYNNEDSLGYNEDEIIDLNIDYYEDTPVNFYNNSLEIEEPELEDYTDLEIEEPELEIEESEEYIDLEIEEEQDIDEYSNNTLETYENEELDIGINEDMLETQEYESTEQYEIYRDFEQNEYIIEFQESEPNYSLDNCEDYTDYSIEEETTFEQELYEPEIESYDFEEDYSDNEDYTFDEEEYQFENDEYTFEEEYTLSEDY